MSKAKREATKGVRKASVAEAAALTVYQLFENEPGPLPLTSETFKTDGGDFLLFVSGSAWRSGGGPTVSFDIFVDDVPCGTSQVWANNTGMHMATIPVTLLIQDLEAGEHTVKLEAVGSTITDQNDYFNVTAEEYVIQGKDS